MCASWCRRGKQRIGIAADGATKFANPMGEGPLTRATNQGWVEVVIDFIWPF